MLIACVAMSPKAPERTHRRRQPREPHPDALSYPVDEAARILGVSRRSLYELISSRRLTSVKLCGRRLVPRAALEQLLAELAAEIEK